MDDVVTRIWQDLVGRLTGPLTLRLIVQPIMASVLATIDGLRDARQGGPPFFWAILTDPIHRHDLIRDGWGSIAKVFSVAVMLDAVYQFIALGWFYPTEALIVAFILAIVPYILVRGPVNRLARGVRRTASETQRS
jgi:hypothetical protein